MKRTLSLLLLLALLLSGCAGESAVPEEQPLRIVAAVFPVYDWARELLGENPAGAELTLLVNKGVDLHSFQPTAADILRLANCDLFLYVGGESDEWVTEALAAAPNEGRIVLNLMALLGDAVKKEELVEGMEGERTEEAEYDEHIWLSLRNAAALTEPIAAALAELDPANAALYAANAAAYREKLAALDAEYQEAAETASTKTLLFGDRFPFRYLTEDYGLSYYAAFSGCSADSEASFETILFLADKLDTLHLPAILQLETSDGSVARTVRDATRLKNQPILTLNSLQAAPESDTTYLKTMEENLAVFRQALGSRVE